MEIKTTDKGYEFIEVDCQYKDFDGKFPCDGKLRIIRFLYKKGIQLKVSGVSGIFIHNKEVDVTPMFYSTLDYGFTVIGIMDSPIVDIDFKKGDDFVFKQFNEQNSKIDGYDVVWDRYRNSVEKIELYFDKK